MASSSAENSPVPLRVAPPNYHPYPPPLASYENVVASPQLFMDTLQKFHAAMRTKFMIPVIGGKPLDLHRLFVEVTTRGGIAKVLGGKRWKEVTTVFSFPSSATNASFILRKYYISLIYHYERVYYFKAKHWTPSPDVLQQVSHAAAPPHGLAGYVLPSPEIEAATPKLQMIETTFPEETAAPSTGSPLCGVIDGKFESGYLITVKIGSEDFKEQHARLKPLYPGKDREISRMIGELWNNLNVPEKMVYQERALQDKERYRLEMEGYRERLRTGQVVNNPLQIQQLPIEHNVDMIDVQSELPSENGNVSWSPEYRPSSDKCAKSNLENSEGTNPNLDAKAPKATNNVGVEALGDEEEFELLKRVDMVECEDKEMQEEEEEADKQELQHSKEKVLFFLEDKTLLPTVEKI
uniref:High mobility group B protein 9-like isoform X2 n=1 Tax=Nicotiana sylvestris TaxID=4096 RepID=A0A1U7X3P4_NICSY|nr:PREDICTED: high mobility group B protein 9-like isoform X2 [Nicotiana sylvestris]